MYALLALLALGLLLAVHELGHLVAARLFGLKVPRFTLGFGPPLLSFRLLGTEYVVAAIPIGASATIHGSNPHTPGLDPADATGYQAQRPWKKLVITLAGSLANYLFALVTLFALYSVGTHVVVPLTVGTVTPGSEAARAQMLPGDKILSVDGQAVKSWSEFVELIGQSAGRERTLIVMRHEESRVVQVRPRPDERGVGRIGVSQQYVYREHGPGEALTRSVVHTQRVAGEALGLVWGFVTGPKPTAEPPSSVAVVRQSSGAASTGLDSFLRVLVAISVALALLHLLPVPGLDGGRLLFLAIESARGRPVSPTVETVANTVGFLAITAAIAAVAVAEVRRALPSSRTPEPAPSAAQASEDAGSPDAGSPADLAAKPDAGPSSGDAGAPVALVPRPALIPASLVGDAGVAPVPDAEDAGTPATDRVSDGGRPSPDAGGATSLGAAPVGGVPLPDVGRPAVPGPVPDGGAVSRDAGAADAG
ncbi:MAG TPA: site-2 protease family protein [Myxococcaceae bacterium]|jgi:regulator of sigma E protease